MSAARTVLRVRARIGTDRAHDLTAEIAPGVTVGAFADAVAARVGAAAHQSVTLERTGTTLRGDQRLLAAGVRNGDTLTLGGRRRARSRTTPRRASTSSWSAARSRARSSASPRARS